MENSFKFNFGSQNEISDPSKTGESNSVNANTENYDCRPKKVEEYHCTEGTPEPRPMSKPELKEHVLTIGNVDSGREAKSRGEFLIYTLNVLDNYKENTSKYLLYRSNDSINSLMDEKQKITDKLVEVLKDSDLNSGVYEGGFKVWECSFDLVDFLVENDIELSGKNVLEMGCGAALPGIFTLLLKSDFVCLQDFNAEVIDYFTIPNVIANYFEQNNIGSSDEDFVNIVNALDVLSKKCMFLSGSWKSTSSHLLNKNKKFDVILSSETIYNPCYYNELHELVCSSLHCNGIAIFANKSYYFGVGGGTQSFLDFVSKRGKLTAHVAKEFTEDVKREIIILKWK